MCVAWFRINKNKHSGMAVAITDTHKDMMHTHMLLLAKTRTFIMEATLDMEIISNLGLTNSHSRYNFC